MEQAGDKILQTLEYTGIRSIVKLYCASPLGRNLAERLVPIDSIEKVRRALTQVTEMAGYLEGEKRLPLRGAIDAVNVIEQARGKNRTIEPKELYSIAVHLGCAARLQAELKEGFSGKRELETLLAKIPDLEDLEAEITRTVDANGEVLSSASPRLTAVRQKKERLQNEVRRKAEGLLSNRDVARYLQDANITLRNDRMVLPVRIECRHQIKGILHDYSASGQTAFIEPEVLVEKQNLIERKRAQERKEITTILWARTRRLIEVLEEVRAGQRIMAWLDFTQARALYSMDFGMKAPEVREEGVLILRQARHPLLLHMAFRNAEGPMEDKRASARDQVVPINLHLGDRFDVLVITGPNTGGKTVTLKTAGLLSLMAASGLHVPVDEGTSIPFFHRILADIGDEQDLAQSLSTFSSHMQRISGIIERADMKTLVLLDELGTGTDPLEGEALGRAIMKYLLQTGAKVLVSTHLSKLKEFAFTSPRVENGSVEFNPDTLKPTFHLRIGVPGESNAIRIARRLGLPESILREAEEGLEMPEQGMRQLMDAVQRIRIQTEHSLEKTQQEAQTLQKLREQAEDHEKEAAFKRSILDQEAEREIEKCLRDGRDRILSILRKLKNLPAGDRKYVEELERAAMEMTERSPLSLKRKHFVEGLKKGDLVYIPRFREKCRVIRIWKKEGTIEVDYRNLSVKVAKDEVMWPHWY